MQLSDMRASFSPLHEGDASVAYARLPRPQAAILVSVPFTRGTPLWRAADFHGPHAAFAFQSPSRGGRLCGAATLGSE